MIPLPSTGARISRVVGPQWEVIEAAEGITVDGPTVLLDWTNLGVYFDAIVAHIDNTDAATSCDITIQGSNGGVRPSSERVDQKTAAPLTETSVRLDPPNPFSWAKITATSASPVVVGLTILGIRRL